MDAKSQLAERPQLLSQDLCATLTEAIVRGDLAQGSKISEPELARRYGVSRGPLREAILRLQGMGLVERAPHIGARVVQLNLQQILDIYAIRESLEGMACKLAAERLSTGQLEQLKGLLEQHQAYLQANDGRLYLEQEGDFDFHYQIILASGNERLIALLCDELYHLLRMYRYQVSRAGANAERALREHWSIWQALDEGDGELAEILMRRHIRRSRKTIEDQAQMDQANTRRIQ